MGKIVGVFFVKGFIPDEIAILLAQVFLNKNNIGMGLIGMVKAEISRREIAHVNE